MVAATVPTTGEYICVVEKMGESDEMTVLVALTSASQIDNSLCDRLEQHLKNAIGVRIRAQLVPPRQLAELTGLSANAPKARRLIDTRKADAVKR